MYPRELVNQAVNVSPERQDGLPQPGDVDVPDRPAHPQPAARHFGWYSTELRAVITRIQTAGSAQPIGTSGNADSNPDRITRWRSWQ
jgi:hypothetical protein